jgi:putative thioredoxin
MCEGLAMSTQPGKPPRPALDLRGAVDLGALAKRRPAPATAKGVMAPPGATSGPATSAPDRATGGPVDGSPAATELGVVIDVTDATFVAEVIERSRTVPVVMDFWADWCQPCKQLSPVLERLAAQYAGAFLLAKVDLDANPQLGQAFQVQSIPAVYAVLRGQPVPLFQGAQPEPQVRVVLDELLRVATANGVTGRIEVASAPALADEPVEEALPPLLQAAYDAIDRGDLPAAADAYEAALKENPGDDEARLGLAQVRLLERAQGVDPGQARAAAAKDPLDVAAQLLAADVDLLGGQVEDGFARLVATVRATTGAERERVRLHLVQLFEVVGNQDPRVAAARLSLANALF